MPEPASRPAHSGRLAAALATLAVTVAAMTVITTTTAGGQVDSSTSTTTTTTPPPAPVTAVMARPQLSAADIVGWFRSTGKVSRATVGIDQLAQLFISEGNAEGVAGDLAFAQSIVETGYFSFSERVPPEYNNFSGIGAVDSGTGANDFPDAQTGVRAQMQHLRAYADPHVTVERLAHPVVDPRFHLVSPKGRAPYWEQFGRGVWATDPDYAGKVLRIHQNMVEWARLHGPSRFAPYATPEPFVRRVFNDLLFRFPSDGELALWSTALRSGQVTPEAMAAHLLRGPAEGGAPAVVRIYQAAFDRAPDHGGLMFWTARRFRGASLDELARQFVASGEFEDRYGAPSSAQFVDLLYLNVLGRPADSSGRSYWVSTLESGRYKPATLLIHFSESPEHKARVAGRVHPIVVHHLLHGEKPSDDDWQRWQAFSGRPGSVETLIYWALVDDRFRAG